MELIIAFLQNIGPWVAAVVSVLISLVALFSLIPGDQPEKALQAVVDFLKKFSVK